MKIEAKYITLIEDYLMEVETQKSWKILVAFLGGNAALGLPQLDEELVVNYIYIDNSTKKKTIGKSVGMTFHGYSIDNFIEKLSKQNKSCMEMAHSPVVYIGDVDFCRRITRLSKESFSESKALIAYWSKNTNPDFQLRRIRNRLSCKWIYEHHTMPPMDFKRLVEATVDDEGLKEVIFGIANGTADLRDHPKIVHLLGMIKMPLNSAMSTDKNDLVCEFYLLALDMRKKYIGRIYEDTDEQEQEVLE